ncbi:MAG: hypothetical protein Q8R32_00785 [bacterium]|nr:hypothetical protein [bacterium]
MLLVFLILTALLLGATALVVLSIGNLRGVGNIAVSSQALYAADTGIERGIDDYRWNDPRTPERGCTTQPNVPVGGSAAYDLTVVGVDPGRPPGGCPTFQELSEGRRALCVQAIGKTRGGSVRRRVTNDTVPPGANNPCER